MKASKWLTPYIKIKGKKKRVIQPTSKSGAYLIRDRNTKKILYVGKSHTQLQATIYRHFTVWKRPKNNFGDYGYKWYESTKNLQVRVIQRTQKQADRLELILITTLRPKDNSAKIKLLFDNLEYNEKLKALQDYEDAQYAMNAERLRMEYDDEVVPF